MQFFSTEYTMNFKTQYFPKLNYLISLLFQVVWQKLLSMVVWLAQLLPALSESNSETSENATDFGTKMATL